MLAGPSFILALIHMDFMVVMLGSLLLTASFMKSHKSIPGNTNILTQQIEKLRLRMTYLQSTHLRTCEAKVDVQGPSGSVGMVTRLHEFGSEGTEMWLGELRSDGSQRVSVQGLQQTGIIWRHWGALGSKYCQGMMKRRVPEGKEVKESQM